MNPGPADEHRLVARVRGLLRSPQRSLIGVAGTPGAGKTTFAQWFTAALCEAGVRAANVPMDGFHLADAELLRRGRLDRKGAADTFDGDGYLALLRRLRDERGHTVYAPAFDRQIEQPIAGAIAVEPDVEVVVTEGNYLLADAAPWPDVYDAVDEVWFCDVDAVERRSRLIARHVRFGKTPEQAATWVDTVDEVNAQGVEPGRARAALVLLPHEWPPPAAS